VKIKETLPPPAEAAIPDLDRALPPDSEGITGYRQSPLDYEPHQGHWFQERWYRWMQGVPLRGLSSSATLGHIDEGRWYPLSVGIISKPSHEDFAMRSPNEVTRPFSDLEKKLVRDTILFIEQNIDREGTLNLSKCSVHGSIVLPHKVCREVIRVAKEVGYNVAETEPLFHTEIRLPFPK
jgi:ribosomal protein L32